MLCWFPSVRVCVRGRSCGVFASTRLKCVFGTSRTRADPFTASPSQTASDVTAWSKWNNRLGCATNTHTHAAASINPPQLIRDDSCLSRSGSAALVPVQPKGRFTSWTQSATRSWRSCTATATRWRLCALPRIATSWAERGNLTEKWPSGRWNRRNCSLTLSDWFTAPSTRDGNMKELQMIFWRFLLNPEYLILLSFHSFLWCYWLFHVL